jgi:hypothetical protein
MLNVKSGRRQGSGERNGGERNLLLYLAQKSALVVMVDMCVVQ